MYPGKQSIAGYANARRKFFLLFENSGSEPFGAKFTSMAVSGSPAVPRTSQFGFRQNQVALKRVT
jgi:hypothetical protein